MQNPSSQQRQYELVAQISKAKGLNGQLIAHELGGLSVLYPGLEVWIVPPMLEGIRHTFITEVVDHPHKQGVTIRLEGVDGRDQTKDLAERYLLARTEDLIEEEPDFDEDADDEDGFFDDFEEGESSDEPMPSASAARLGMQFTDTTQGELGVLIQIKPGMQYNTWVIEGPFGLLDIPAVDAYIAKSDATTITLTLPKGFIEIVAPAPKPEKSKGAKDE